MAKISVTQGETIELEISGHILTIRTSQSGAEGSRAGDPKPQSGERRKVSATARARMAEGQRKRWAGIHTKGKNAPPSMEIPAPAPKKRKRRMSAEARARIAESARKRWAVAKKAGKKTL